MKALNRTLVLTFGAALALIGLVVLFSGGVSLPTRSPPRQFYFSGASLFLLGSAPLLLGVTSLALGLQVIGRESGATRLAIGAGIIMLGLAFVLAPKS